MITCSEQKSKSSKPESKEQKSADDKVVIDEEKLAKRELLTEKLKNKELGLYVYEPFNLPFVDFELEDLNGKKVQMSDFKGKVIFLNFWATWCGPCRSEMPSMEKLYNALKNKGLVMLAINLQEDKKKVAAFMNSNKLTFPVLLDTTGKIGSIYGARNIPTTYLFDKSGFAVFGTAGAREWNDDQHMEIFRHLLEESE